MGQKRLFRRITDEDLDQAYKELQQIEEHYGRSEKKFNKPLRPPLSQVYFALGHGLYNAGKISSATITFKKSIHSKISPHALLQLAIIHAKQGNQKHAEAYLTQIEKFPLATTRARLYWHGRVESIRGKAFEQVGKKQESHVAFKKAIAIWKRLQEQNIEPEDHAEILTHMAYSLYAVGKIANAMNALDFAIDLLPERKETYADVISLLSTWGHLPEALDAYHRILGRDGVSEYLKTYCSFWIIGLARRAGTKPAPLAIAHLQSLTSGSWYTKIAGFILGKTSFVQLQKEADTPGKLAEVYFYQASQLLAQGKLDEAKELWKKVIATKMMAFYEFDMSVYFLRHGVKKVTVSPVIRKKKDALP